MKPLVLQSDFGYADGAVSAMYGVAESVSDRLHIYDLTHEIGQYNIWEASYRLIQTIGYWPKESVFVSVVDPGVGSTRRSIAVKTNGGQYVISPDNGTLTHIKRLIGLTEAREIDEITNRLPGSGESYTFHGRDIYAYTGARLAAGILPFGQIGSAVPIDSVIELPVEEPRLEGNVIHGNIDVLDVRFGSLWTNVPREMFTALELCYGNMIEVCISNETRILYHNFLAYKKSFADVRVGEALVYVNSLDNIAVAINQGSFARAYNIGTGNSWHISLSKGPKLIFD